MRVKVLSSQNPVLQLALEEIAENLFQAPDFGLISVSPTYPPEDVPNCIEKILGIKEYAAFQSIDSFCNTETVRDGVSAMLFFFEKNAYVEVYYKEKLTKENFENTKEEVLNYLRGHKNSLNVIIGDFADKLFPVLICSLGKTLKEENLSADNICGGIISAPVENGVPQKGYVFVDGKGLEGGFFIVSLANVRFTTGVARGVFKRGPIYTITSAEMFEIYELDDAPAYKIAEKLLQGLENPTPKYLWYTPIAVIDSKEEEIITIRTVKDFRNNKLELWAPIEEGEKIKIAFVTPEEIIKDVFITAKKLKKEFKEAEAILNFSCVARQWTLENLAQEESKIYAQVINAPLFGFFTHGEIASSKEKLKLHNQTSVVTLLKEA